MQTITITVSGQSGVGKSTVIRDLLSMLSDYGYGPEVTYEGKSVVRIPSWLQGEQRASRLALLARLKSGDLAINVNEVQLNREPVSASKRPPVAHIEEIGKAFSKVVEQAHKS